MKIKVDSIYNHKINETYYPVSAYIIGLNKEGDNTYAFVVFEDGEIHTIPASYITIDWEHFEFGGISL